MSAIKGNGLCDGPSNGFPILNGAKKHYDALVLLRFSHVVVATNTAGAAADAAGTTRVGRWMSQAEYDAMVKSGEVQIGGGGTTYVVNPANPGAYVSSKPGTVYVEFDVPGNAIRPTSPGQGQIPSADSTVERLAVKRGQPVSPGIPASNIKVVQSK